MNADCVIDTNIWLYAFIASQDEQKSQIAAQTIQTTQPAVSTQIINETCVNLLRKAAFSEAQVTQLIASFYSKYPVLDINRRTLEQASHLRQSYNLSFWDSLITATALGHGIDTLYSEDMQHGLVINETLTVLNPFTPS